MADAETTTERQTEATPGLKLIKSRIHANFITRQK